MTIQEERAYSFIKLYIGYEIPVEKVKSIIDLMVLEDNNRIGAEGLNNRSVSGISESYLTDYSPIIYKALNKLKRIKVVKADVE